MSDTTDERKAPWPKTRDELIAYIDDLMAEESTYDSCVEHLHLAAEAAFNYVWHVRGVTGFQAGFASLRLYGQINHIDGPFGVLRAFDYVYPQYGTPMEKAREWYGKWMPWISEQARERLKDTKGAHPNVVAHWQMLADRAEAQS